MRYDELLEKLPEVDLWQYLSKCGKNIVMYGMGNGADKIIAELDKIGLEVADFFASDGFVRGQYFHGKRVMTFAEIKKKYDNFVVLVSFGSEIPEVIANIEKIDAEAELYLPDVPVAGDGLFTIGFFNENREKFKAAFELLADERSREVFADVILYKLTGKLLYLLAHTDTDEQVYAEFFTNSGIKTAADLGAYNGDSARLFAEVLPGLEHIIALEPDRKNFTKLLRNTESLRVSVEAHNICAWSKRKVLVFDRGGNRNSSVGAIGHTPSVGDTKTVEINGDSLDNIVANRPIDFVKYDVEGSEYEALVGSEQTLKTNAAAALVSAYHRNDDLYKLVLKLNEILPTHKLYLRRKRCVPAWEISLIAVR